MEKLIKEYLDAIRKAYSLGRQIADKLVEAIKPIIPDIEYDEASSCADLIFLSSEDRGSAYLYRNIGRKPILPLYTVIEEAFPELKNYIDSEAWVTEEEAEKLKQILLHIKKGET